MPQQQTLDAVFAQCAEPLPAAMDDPQKHGSPPLSPIAIRQMILNRIGRPQENTAENSKTLLGIGCRQTI